MNQPSSNLKRVRGGGPIAWMAKNSVAANILMLVCLVGGFIGFTNIKKEVFPDFDLDIVTITTAYPGASPEDVEQGIVLAIEEAISDLEDIEQVTSTANEGVASIQVELQTGVDAQQLYNNIKQEVDRIRTLPGDAEEPQVTLLGGRRAVMTLALYGDTDELSLRNLAEEVRDTLLSHSGISKVNLNDARELEIHIEIPEAKLNAYGLTLQNVADSIRNNVVEVSGGSVSTQAGEILLRVAERKDFADEFAQLPILSPRTGSPVMLGDIASVKDGFEDVDKFASYNGHPSVELVIDRVGDQTPIGVSEATYEALEKVRAILPQGIDISVVDDRSEIYQQRLDLLMKNAWLGLLVVMAMLTLFLDLKLAFWVTMGIPISFMGAMLFIPSFGVSFNMISMFAFIIALGIVVDDAIVAGENIYEYRQRGYNLIDAAVQGARDVAVPVTFSILSNVVAFGPLLFVDGWIGKIWMVIPAVVCTVFVVSLFEALFILPAHLAYTKVSPNPNRFQVWQQNFSSGFSAWVSRVYGPILDVSVRNRYLSLAVGVALMIVVVSWPVSGRMGFELFPSVESDRSEVRAVLPLGSTAQEVKRVNNILVTNAQTIIDQHGGSDKFKGIYSSINENRITVKVYLDKPELRPISTFQYTNEWRELTGTIAGVDSVRFASDAGGPGSGPAFSVELSHRDVGTLSKASERLAQALAEYPMVTEIDDGFQEGKAQFSFTLNEEARRLGLTSNELGRQIRAAFFGAEALRQQRGRNEVKIVVKRPEGERLSQTDVTNLLIQTRDGVQVPLHSLVEFSPDRAYSTITRRDGRRTVTVTANVNPRKEAQRVKTTIEAEVLPALLADYPGLSYSFEGQQRQFTDAISALMLGYVVVLGLIYILLAVPFKSYLQPLIVMFAIPFGIFGAVIGHLIMGYSISIISVMGIIALSGVVVNDSLVMVSYANDKMREGLSPLLAICESGTRRFRPIMLTTISTFGGLAPMIFETSRQARFMIPMALSLGYGILFATAITLLLVPCLFMVIEDIRSKLGTDIHSQQTSE